jgi:hypothetical protein
VLGIPGQFGADPGVMDPDPEISLVTLRMLTKIIFFTTLGGTGTLFTHSINQLLD